MLHIRIPRHLEQLLGWVADDRRQRAEDLASALSQGGPDVSREVFGECVELTALQGYPSFFVNHRCSRAFRLLDVGDVEARVADASDWRGQCSTGRCRGRADGYASLSLSGVARSMNWFGSEVEVLAAAESTILSYRGSKSCSFDLNDLWKATDDIIRDVCSLPHSAQGTASGASNPRQSLLVFSWHSRQRYS